MKPIISYHSSIKNTASPIYAKECKPPLYADKNAHNCLAEHFVKFGYFPDNHTTGLWHHATREIQFCLVVDNFGVKYINKADANHPNAALSRIYKITSVWSGNIYLGLTMKWDYKAQTSSVSIPGYVANVLKKLNHTKDCRPQHCLYPWKHPIYSAPFQLTS